MTTRTVHEKRILKELRGMPESALLKIEKVIRLLKEDFLGKKSDENSTERLLALCGSWKDTRPVQQQIEDVYAARTPSEERESLR
jgi:hypothetical protein